MFVDNCGSLFPEAGMASTKALRRVSGKNSKEASVRE